MSQAALQIPLDFDVRPAYGESDFLIGQSNQDAIAWIDRWPTWPAPVLTLSGPAACGKTHLSAVWQAKSGAFSLPAKALTTQSADDIVKAASDAHIVIDGVDPWLGDLEAETTLFHLYNMFKETGRSVMLTMRMTPTQVEFAIPDLASRLRGAPVVSIHSPDDMLLGSVLIKLFSDRQLIVGNEVIKYILPRMERSFSAARDIVALADKMALTHKRKISVPLMRDVMEEM